MLINLTSCQENVFNLIVTLIIGVLILIICLQPAVF